MAVLGLSCSRAGARPAPGEMLTSHATLGAAVEDAFPGLTGMQLAKAEPEEEPVAGAGTGWGASTGSAGAPGIPQAGAAFSPVQGIATRYADVVDA